MSASAALRTTGRLYWHRRWVLLGVLAMAGVFAIALVPATRHLTAVALVIPEGDKLLHPAPSPP